jgi:hypothetical protein
MFLQFLTKEEKEAFLQLAHFIARADDKFSDEEREIIKGYCSEMQIEDIGFDEDNFELNKVLGFVKSKKSQKIFLFEIMALIYSDEVLDKEEKRIIDFILKKFDIDENIASIYQEWTKSILALYRQANYLLELEL